MGLIDDDDVPIAFFEVDAEIAFLFQGVHRNDGLIVIVEWVGVSRNILADALDAGAVEAHERNGEARPQLLLELSHHGLRCDNEDAFAFAETDRIGEQDAVTDLPEGLQGGVELKRHDVDCGAVADPQVVVGRRRLTEQTLQVEAGVGKAG